MKVFRLTRKKYNDPLSGKGAAIKGARWNSAGTEILYTSSSRALAMAEVYVHLSLNLLPKDFIMVQINIPDYLTITTIPKDQLPQRWNEFPYTNESQGVGDLFISEKQNPILQVPSAIVAGDFNYLINTSHPDFEELEIDSKSDFPFDGRLFKI